MFELVVSGHGNVMMSKIPKCDYSNATETLRRHARDSVS